MLNKCAGCPYYLRASNRLAICVWDRHPENPTGCDDKIVRFYRASIGEGNG